MRKPHCALGLVLATSVLSVPCWAQSELRARPITGPIQDAGIYHHATGTWTRPGQGMASFGADVLYNNNANTGYWATTNDDWTFFEEGRIPGDNGDVGNSACYQINCYQTAYCTNQATTWARPMSSSAIAEDRTRGARSSNSAQRIRAKRTS